MELFDYVCAPYHSPFFVQGLQIDPFIGTQRILGKHFFWDWPS